jgi:hypothetical protein
LLKFQIAQRETLPADRQPSIIFVNWVIILQEADDFWKRMRNLGQMDGRSERNGGIIIAMADPGFG